MLRVEADLDRAPLPAPRLRARGKEDDRLGRRQSEHVRDVEECKSDRPGNHVAVRDDAAGLGCNGNPIIAAGSKVGNDDKAVEHRLVDNPA